MKEKLLLTSSFLPRKIVLLPETDEPNDSEPEETKLKVSCTECGKLTGLILSKEVKTQCKHEEQCTECRDHQIEKCLRCSNCCPMLLGFTPAYCCSECKRKLVTQKSSAMCAICETNLQRECKFCKRSSQYQDAKHLLKQRVFVLVQSPHVIINLTQRPCAHYSICRQCKQRMARGHKGKSTCRVCRQDNSITSFIPPVNKISKVKPPSSLQQDDQSTKESISQIQNSFSHYPSKNYSAFSGHSVLSVTNRQRDKQQPPLYCKLQPNLQATFMGVGDDLASGIEFPKLAAIPLLPTLPSFKSLLASSGSSPIETAQKSISITTRDQTTKYHSSPPRKTHPPLITPVRVNEDLYNVAVNKIW